MKLILQNIHNNNINFIGLRNQNLAVLDFARIQRCLCMDDQRITVLDEAGGSFYWTNKQSPRVCINDHQLLNWVDLYYYEVYNWFF